ncbi:hypothetical protein T01_16015, partial [Trichinella spiralis]
LSSVSAHIYVQKFHTTPSLRIKPTRLANQLPPFLAAPTSYLWCWKFCIGWLPRYHQLVMIICRHRLPPGCDRRIVPKLTRNRLIISTIAQCSKTKATGSNCIGSRFITRRQTWTHGSQTKLIDRCVEMVRRRGARCPARNDRKVYAGENGLGVVRGRIICVIRRERTWSAQGVIAPDDSDAAKQEEGQIREGAERPH